MPRKFNNRVKETSTSVGAGNITLAGAASQFSSFSSRYAVGDLFTYTIAGQTGTEWETGTGYLFDTVTLVRDSVEQSSNADGFVVFSAGTKDVFVDYTAVSANTSQDNGQTLALMSGMSVSN
jgi:hypothetical protein